MQSDLTAWACAKMLKLSCFFSLVRSPFTGSCVFCAPLDRYIGRHIDQLSTDVSVDISVDIPTYRSRVGRYVDRDVSVDI